MDPTQFQSMVDHAASMNDRWLMIALLGLLILGGGATLWAMHRFMNSIYQTLVSELKADRDKLGVIVDRNSNIIAENNHELRAFLDYRRSSHSGRTE
jgi:hypothetical protein